MKPRFGFLFFVPPILFAGLGVIGAPLSRDGDLWLHLKTGQVILQTFFGKFQFLDNDIFSYTANGAANEVHSWLGQCLLYLAYASGGAVGLKIFQAALLAAASVALGGFIYRRTESEFVSAFGVCLALLIHREMSDIKPALLGAAAFCVFVFFFIDETRSWKWRRWGIPFTLLWVNVHGSGLLAIPLALLFSVGPFFRGDKKWLTFVLGVALATLANPHGWRAYQIAVGLGSTARSLGVVEWSREALFEWRPGGFILTFSAINFSVLFLVVTLGYDYFYAGRKPKKGRLIRWANYLGSILAVFLSRRNGIYLVLPVTLAVLAWHEVWSNIKWAKSVSKKWRPWIAVAPGAQAAFLVLLFLAAGFPFGLGSQPMPERAMDFVEGSGISGKTFNHQLWGGYLEFRDFPNLSTGIDSRILVHRDRAALLVSSKSPNGLVDIARVLHELPETQILIHESSIPLRSALEADWLIVFENNLATVALKRTAGNDANLEKVKSYYSRLGVPFDPEHGFVFARGLAANPEWVAHFQETPLRGSWALPSRQADGILRNADFYQSRGVPGLALACLNKGVEDFPDDWRLAIRFGELLAQTGQTEAARKWLASLEHRKIPSPAMVPLRTALRQPASGKFTF